MSREPENQPPAENIALTIVQDGKRRDVTVRELAVGNKLAGDALLSLLVEKGIVTAAEFQERIKQLSQQHLRPGHPPAADKDPAPGDGS